VDIYSSDILAATCLDLLGDVHILDGGDGSSWCSTEPGLPHNKFYIKLILTFFIFSVSHTGSFSISSKCSVAKPKLFVLAQAFLQFWHCSCLLLLNPFWLRLKLVTVNMTQFMDKSCTLHFSKFIDLTNNILLT
jgi:hypothetical protein